MRALHSFGVPAVAVLAGGICVATASPAFALDPSRSLTQYARRVWTSEDGLPQNSVQAIAQTADGYLWVGTQRGLARFDGVRFVPFALRTNDGRPDGDVWALCGDGPTLWVGTALALYRLEAGRFVETRTAEGGPVVGVPALFRDRSQRLWVGAKDGAVFTVVNGVARSVSHARQVPRERVTDIAEAPDGRLCIAATAIHCLEAGAWRRIEIPPRPRQGVNEIAFDASGALWAGLVAGDVVRRTDGSIERWPQANPVLALLLDREGNTWFSAAPVGAIGRIGGRGRESLEPEPGTTHGIVSALFEDRDGSLWVGRNPGGLERLSAPPFVPFSTPEGLRESSVNCVLEDRAGAVWIGTAGGLHRLAAGRITAVDLESKEILSLAEDREGRLWVGAVGGIFVREGERFVRVEAPERITLSLRQDQIGRMWAGAVNGVLRLEAGRFRPVEELRDVNATAILSRPGELWFANGLGGGVVRWREGQVTGLGANQGIRGALAVALHEDGDGVLWIGTHLGGLVRLKDGKAFSVGGAQGLCDDSVFSIEEDDSGRLWMTSNAGVFAVRKDELAAVAAGRASRVACRLFGVADGMRSAECNGGQQPSAFRDRTGRIWFATVDGAVRVDPKEVAAPAPSVVVEELLARGRDFASSAGGAPIEIPPGPGEVSLRYTALALAAAERTRFRYRLEGLDDAWVDAGDRRVSSYAHLAPGRYRFRVQAQVPGSPWSEPGAELTFRIQPRFFETWWFAALALTSVAGLVFTGYETRVSALRRRQRWLEAQVEDRTRELAEINATLEQRVEEGVAALRESDRMAAFGHLVAGVAHEVRHPIFALRTAAHLLTQKLQGSDQTKEELGILERETERMNRLVDDLLELGRPRQLECVPVAPSDLVDEVLTSFGRVPTPDVTVGKEIDGALPSIRVDRAAMVQVLLNLLHNACRHAVGLRRLVVGAHAGDGVVRLTVADDGAGISLKDQARIFEPFFSTTGSTGLGLAIAQRLVREHGGRISVRSTPGEGTVFTIELPVADDKVLT